jgi:hypothetical protein
MLPHGIEGKTMQLRRVTDDGRVTEFEIQGQDLGSNDGITFSVDADVEVGDEVTETLPNGKLKTMRLVEVQVFQSPFGTNMLDHTGAKYEVVSGRRALRQPTPITLPDLHQLISAASGSQIATSHYDDAVFNAFKAVEDRVKKLTGHPKKPERRPAQRKRANDVGVQRTEPPTRHHLSQRRSGSDGRRARGFQVLIHGRGAGVAQHTRARPEPSDQRVGSDGDARHGQSFDAGVGPGRNTAQRRSGVKPLCVISDGGAAVG